MKPDYDKLTRELFAEEERRENGTRTPQEEKKGGILRWFKR